MQPNEYQAKAKRTQCDYEKAAERMHSAYPFSSAGINSYGNEERLRAIRINHAVIGLIGELGEIASVLQKWIYYGKPFTVEEIQAKFADEGGDCQWYLALLFDVIGVPMEKILDANIAKLAVRYPEKFTELAAEIRDREAEAQAINSRIVVNNIATTGPLFPVLISAQMCDQCRGRGIVRRDVAGTTISEKCPKCAGSGFLGEVETTTKPDNLPAPTPLPVDPYPPGSPCRICLGTGMVYTYGRGSHTCPDCNGTGKTPDMVVQPTLPQENDAPLGDTGPMS